MQGCEELEPCVKFELGALTRVQVVCKQKVQMQVPVSVGSPFNSTTKECFSYWIRKGLSKPPYWKQNLKLKFEQMSNPLHWTQELGILRRGEPFISCVVRENLDSGLKLGLKVNKEKQNTLGPVTP